MNPHHILLAATALFLIDILEVVESNPTIGNFESFASQMDDVDMTLLHRALRQGNDCDSQVDLAQSAFHNTIIPRGDMIKLIMKSAG